MDEVKAMCEKEKPDVLVWWMNFSIVFETVVSWFGRSFV
jgi:hypothetical protein